MAQLEQERILAVDRAKRMQEELRKKQLVSLAAAAAASVPVTVQCCARHVFVRRLV